MNARKTRDKREKDTTRKKESTIHQSSERIEGNSPPAGFHGETSWVVSFDGIQYFDTWSRWMGCPRRLVVVVQERKRQWFAMVAIMLLVRKKTRHDDDNKVLSIDDDDVLMVVVVIFLLMKS